MYLRLLSRPVLVSSSVLRLRLGLVTMVCPDVVASNNGADAPIQSTRCSWPRIPSLYQASPKLPVSTFQVSQLQTCPSYSMTRTRASLKRSNSARLLSQLRDNHWVRLSPTSDSPEVLILSNQSCGRSLSRLFMVLFKVAAFHRSSLSLAPPNIKARMPRT